MTFAGDMGCGVQRVQRCPRHLDTANPVVAGIWEAVSRCPGVLYLFNKKYTERGRNASVAVDSHIGGFRPFFLDTWTPPFKSPPRLDLRCPRGSGHSLDTGLGRDTSQIPGGALGTTGAISYQFLYQLDLPAYDENSHLKRCPGGGRRSFASLGISGSGDAIRPNYCWRNRPSNGAPHSAVAPRASAGRRWIIRLGRTP